VLNILVDIELQRYCGSACRSGPVSD